jgi:hypothetical protein
LQVLFLIRYVDEMKGNVDNLVTLCLDQIDATAWPCVGISKRACSGSNGKRSSAAVVQLLLSHQRRAGHQQRSRPSTSAAVKKRSYWAS